MSSCLLPASVVPLQAPVLLMVETVRMIVSQLVLWDTKVATVQENLISDVVTRSPPHRLQQTAIPSVLVFVKMMATLVMATMRVDIVLEHPTSDVVRQL